MLTDPAEIQRAIGASRCRIGDGVEVGEGVVFRFGWKPPERVLIGDNVRIGAHCRFDLPELVIKDYTRIYEFSLIYGYHACRIGYNCWIGRNVILNCTAPLQVSDNVCIGAASQIYTHTKFADPLLGYVEPPAVELRIGSDSWIGAGALVLQSQIGKEAVIAAGSVLTKDVPDSGIFGGVPAEDISKKVDPIYRETDPARRMEILLPIYESFFRENPHLKSRRVRIVEEFQGEEGVSTFSVQDRRYSRLRSGEEIEFMLHLLPSIKFIPRRDARAW